MTFSQVWGGVCALCLLPCLSLREGRGPHTHPHAVSASVPLCAAAHTHSVFKPGGFMPPGTTAIEKRTIASFVPTWESSACTQVGVPQAAWHQLSQCVALQRSSLVSCHTLTCCARRQQLTGLPVDLISLPPLLPPCLPPRSATSVRLCARTPPSAPCWPHLRSWLARPLALTPCPLRPARSCRSISTACRCVEAAPVLGCWQSCVC